MLAINALPNLDGTREPESGSRFNPEKRSAISTKSLFDGLKLPTILQKTNPVPSTALILSEDANKGNILIRMLKSGRDVVVNTVDFFLSNVAADPKSVATLTSGLASLGIDLLPFIGPVKKFADGRALLRQDNFDLKNEGRCLCLISIFEMALDAITAGGSALLPDEILTYPRMFRDYQRRVQQEKNPSKMFPDPVSLIARGLLKIPAVSSLLDKLIFSTVPLKKDLA